MAIIDFNRKGIKVVEALGQFLTEPVRGEAYDDNSVEHISMYGTDAYVEIATSTVSAHAVVGDATSGTDVLIDSELSCYAPQHMFDSQYTPDMSFDSDERTWVFLVDIRDGHFGMGEPDGIELRSVAYPMSACDKMVPGTMVATDTDMMRKLSLACVTINDGKPATMLIGSDGEDGLILWFESDDGTVSVSFRVRDA